MDTKLKILLALIGVAFVCVVVWAVATTPEAPTLPTVNNSESPDVVNYVGNTISEEVNGVKVWELTAEKSAINIITQDAELQNIIGHFYQKNGRIVELRAKSGTYDNTTKNVHVEGDVIVTTDDGAKLTSVKLDWLNNEYKLIAKEKVNITKDDIKATGDMAESIDGFRHFKIKGHAHIVKGVTYEP